MKKSKETRYLPSWGLALVEEKEMKQLGQLAREGWLLESFAFLGYKLRKAEPQELDYALDIHAVLAGERADYVEMFAASGWKLVCSQGDLHIFSAAPGTQPIYSDKSTMVEKYRRAVKRWKRLSLVSGLATLLAFGLQYFAKNGADQTIISMVLSNLGQLCLVFTVPAVMTYTAFLVRLKRLE